MVVEDPGIGCVRSRAFANGITLDVAPLMGAPRQRPCGLGLLVCAGAKAWWCVERHLDQGSLPPPPHQGLRGSLKLLRWRYAALLAD